MIRRAALAAVLLLVVSTTSVSAGVPTSVSMKNNLTFDPAMVKVALNDSVVWHNVSEVTHTTTANLFNWWDHTIGASDQNSVTMTHAGMWAYHCEIHAGMTGKVKVPMSAPSSTTVGEAVPLVVATEPIPDGFVEDVQKRKAGGTWKLWRSGVTDESTSWTPSRTGTWQFRARLRKTSNGAHTGWGASITIQVTPAG